MSNFELKIEKELRYVGPILSRRIRKDRLLNKKAIQ